MIIFVALLLAALTVAFIAYPLFKQGLRASDALEPEKLHELSFKRDTTYSMLKELEFDHQSGLLTDDDYHDLETRYKGKAISILKDMEDTKKGDKAEDKVEGEIEKQVRELRQSKSKEQFCSQCGTKHSPDARFCPQCGAKL